MSMLALLRSAIYGASTRQEGSFFDISARSIEGEEMLLAKYQGQVVLVVNTASRCGFTGQYAELQDLFERYRERGFSVLGFPSNDFLSQEPQGDKEIASFCALNFNVTFPLFAKAPVSGEKIQPVYKFLTQMSSGKFRGRILWNFEKFLIDRQGIVVARWGAVTSPAAKGVSAEIERRL